MVAKDAARKINILARNEVFVRETKGCGRLDIYDCLSNSYYEVKSEGAAFTNSTNKQMEKYDNAHVLFSSRGNVKRGTKIVSGTFYYGAWKITYQSVANGLISYSCTWSQQRYETAKMIALTSVAIICITALTIASDGAAAPLYTAIPLCIG